MYAVFIETNNPQMLYNTLLIWSEKKKIEHGNKELSKKKKVLLGTTTLVAKS